MAGLPIEATPSPGRSPLQRPSLHTCSMPSANLELVHSIFTTWERSDYSSAVWAHPEIEFVDGSDPGSLLEYPYAVG